MKSKFFPLMTILVAEIFTLTSLVSSGHQNGSDLQYEKCNCEGELTYVRVYEDGHWWQYVYCGDVLVNKNMLED